MRSYLIFIPALCVLGCHQADTTSNASIDLQQKIYKFYAEAPVNQNLQINMVSPNQSINAFCVLSAYEDNVSGESDIEDKVNKKIEALKLVGTEEHWHLIALTGNEIYIIQFASNLLPLISPRPTFDGGNCKTTTSIELIKQASSFEASIIANGLRKRKPVINIKGGN